MRSEHVIALLLAVAGTSTPSLTLAAETTTFNVRLTITQACSITAATATDVDFGSVPTVTTTPLRAQGTLTANCTTGTSYNIALNAGANPGTPNDVNTRRMKKLDSANFVAYQLYRDAANNEVWGSTLTTNTQIGIGTGANQPYQVYGQVTSGTVNTMPPGKYQDTITATISL